jgi:hypothetical protein
MALALGFICCWGGAVSWFIRHLRRIFRRRVFIACARRSSLQPRYCVSRVGGAEVPERDLAWFRAACRYLPLFCGALGRRAAIAGAKDV